MKCPVCNNEMYIGYSRDQFFPFCPSIKNLGTLSWLWFYCDNCMVCRTAKTVGELFAIYRCLKCKQYNLEHGDFEDGEFSQDAVCRRCKNYYIERVRYSDERENVNREIQRRDWEREEYERADAEDREIQKRDWERHVAGTEKISEEEKAAAKEALVKVLRKIAKQNGNLSVVECTVESK